MPGMFSLALRERRVAESSGAAVEAVGSLKVKSASAHAGACKQPMCS